MAEGLASPDELRLLAAGAGPGSTTREALRALIAASVLRLRVQEPLLRHVVDPEAVHQARVATRRLRSDLHTFRSLVRPGWSDGLRAELKWFAAVLGEARDADVLMDRMVASLAEVGGSAAGRHALLQRLARERKDAQARLVVALADARHASLLGALSAAAREPALAAHADDPARDILPGLAAKPWGRLQGAVQRLGEVPPDAELHDVRIRAKAARYAAEAVVPVAGASARRYAEAVASVQEALGDYHDAVVAREWLQRAAGGIRRGGTLLIRALDERERARGADALRAWRPAWKQASRKQLRSWMSHG